MQSMLINITKNACKYRYRDFKVFMWVEHLPLAVKMQMCKLS